MCTGFVYEVTNLWRRRVRANTVTSNPACCATMGAGCGVQVIKLIMLAVIVALMIEVYYSVSVRFV